MALTGEQTAAVEAILSEHPDWTNSAVRVEAGLPPTTLFAVNRVRQRLGIAPVPGASANSGSSGQKKSRSRRPGGRGAGASVESDTLDDDASGPTEPSGPKRSGASKKPQSLLAPVLPRIAQAIAVGVMSGTRSLTQGVAPMTREEAAAIAIPSVRILDRTAAKYIKRSGKVTPNQEDAALIALTIVVWAIGWIVASVQGKPRQQHTVMYSNGVSAATDLFAGSEPSGPSQAAPVPPIAPFPMPAATPATQAPATAFAGAFPEDESDLFAGSEPTAPGAASVTASAARRAPVTGPGPSGVAESTWAALMPTDLGEALVG